MVAKLCRFNLFLMSACYLSRYLFGLIKKVDKRDQELVAGLSVLSLSIPIILSGLFMGQVYYLVKVLVAPRIYIFEWVINHMGK